MMDNAPSSYGAEPAVGTVDSSRDRRLHHSCNVCGARPAANHYNGICCVGCKSFFRRSVRQNTGYVCVEQSGQCPIMNEYRNCCRACRLQKCYVAGMDPRLVRRENQANTDDEVVVVVRRNKQCNRNSGEKEFGEGGGGKRKREFKEVTSLPTTTSSEIPPAFRAARRDSLPDVEQQQQQCLCPIDSSGSRLPITYLPNGGSNPYYSGEIAYSPSLPFHPLVAEHAEQLLGGQQAALLQSATPQRRAAPAGSVGSSSREAKKKKEESISQRQEEEQVAIQWGQHLLRASNRKALEVSSTLALGYLSGLFTTINNCDASIIPLAESSGSLLKAQSSVLTIDADLFSLTSSSSLSECFSPLARYFLRVERFCDSYHNSDASHTDPPPLSASHRNGASPTPHLPPARCDLQLPLGQAISEPGALIARTPMEWSSARCMATTSLFPRLWARCLCYYIDWASHIPELRQLDSGDMVCMLASRFSPCLALIYAQHSIITYDFDGGGSEGGGGCGKNSSGEVVLCSGGVYYPNDDSLARRLIDPQLYPFAHEFCRILFEEVIPMGLEMGISEAELALLKVLCFCTPSSGLSPRSKALISDAHARYLSVLLAEVKGRCSRQQGSAQQGGQSSSSCQAEVTALQQQQQHQMDVAPMRLGKLLGWLPTMERAGRLSDTHIAMMALFNEQMRDTLIYEVHGRAAQWK